MADTGKIAGNDQSQRDKDAAGFKVSVEMVTGGTMQDIDQICSQEVGLKDDMPQNANKG